MYGELLHDSIPQGVARSKWRLNPRNVSEHLLKLWRLDSGEGFHISHDSANGIPFQDILMGETLFTTHKTPNVWSPLRWLYTRGRAVNAMLCQVGFHIASCVLPL